ncbi:MAG: FAD-linked oxidase C-terminal domain-containing protein [Spirosomataceae bacterium]
MTQRVVSVPANLVPPLEQLASQLEGELHFDTVMRTLYATDASAYREMPLAVAIPKTVADIKKLISFAHTHQTSLIPRTAGTSLAGQVVGNGIVVDVSRTFSDILEVNVAESWVRVQPGVVRDELNLFLKNYGLFFGPETSTANRAMIGGMVGNNSCGSNSVVYGSTRDHLLSVKAILSDGSEVEFSATETYPEADGLLGDIYRKTYELLNNAHNQSEIRNEFPKSSIERRNTGYALDMLLDCKPFTPDGPDFNMCRLIAGSEGTLCFLTEIKIHVNPLPLKEIGLVCVHFNSIDESLRANVMAMQYSPSASELIDHYILECTKANPEQRQNRFFVEGDPGALLVIEFRRETRAEIDEIAQRLIAEFKELGFGYHYPIVYGDDTKKVWNLRKAGLGLLSNLPGDEKAVAVIEDTAVSVEDLPAYIREFNEILTKHQLYSVHYAHAGSGELHLRPIINLKTTEGHQQFRTIATEIAHLVKKYKGSLSGEHGDGRLRGEFIRLMVGEHNYQLMKAIKQLWDPAHIFNPNKVVDTPPMDTFLRYEAGHQTPAFNTYFRFHDQDVLQHAEQCNGSADCRKTHLSGGTMCPSYMATRNEKDTTRARANILREALTNSEKLNRFDSQEVKEVMDLCLVCKGCKAECPSNVDVAKLKMEFLQNYYDKNGIPLRSWMIGNFSKLTKVASYVPWGYNFIFKNAPLRRIANQLVGFHPERTMPLLAPQTLKSWFKSRESSKKVNESLARRKVYLFVDEFTNYNDVAIGKTAILLLEKLGYEVVVPTHVDSGRPQLSKGLLKEAKKIAIENVRLLQDVVSAETPLIGIEPSAILTFRDEYPDLVPDEWVEAAKKIGQHALLIDEFIAKEIDAKRINKNQFTTQKQLIKLHGHCQQKAVSSVVPTKKMLSLPENYEVQLIPSGCCGMAGSFGYETEHFEISNKIGELVLFPTVRKQPQDVIIAASGTSCRHQIHDGTGRHAKHPVEILWEALV